MTPPPETPSSLWPLRDLRVVSGDLELRYLDDPVLFELAALAGQGVHAPGAMPFNVPWTAGTPEQVGRSVLRHHWEAHAQTSPAKWSLELATLSGGVPVGMQGMFSTDFAITRTAETGSWLGLRHQGAGLGTRMRVLILHLLFDGFGAETAVTAAWEDNPASNGVSRKLGYKPNGSQTLARQGEPVTHNLFRLDRADWDARPEFMRPEVEMHGVEAAKELLEIA